VTRLQAVIRRPLIALHRDGPHGSGHVIVDVDNDTAEEGAEAPMKPLFAGRYLPAGVIEPGLFVDVVAEQGARVAAVARQARMDGPVPHMRKWKLSDVVAHLGGVHRWAAGIVAARDWTGSGHRRGRASGDELISWFDDGLAQLVSVLGGADFSATCPNFSPGTTRTVAFWARRQAHETTVHRWDAEACAGDISPIDPMLATDGIDEMLMVFRRVTGGQPLDAPVGLVTTDTGASWRVSPAVKPGRVEIEFCDGPTGETAATVAAPAEALLLALWGRLPATGGAFRITGRRDLALALLPGPR
jgi:uncharacterized protein (TIGR03083 family)